MWSLACQVGHLSLQNIGFGFSFTSRCRFWFIDFIFLLLLLHGLCAPIDVPAFTYEFKIKLSSKCRGKAETDFTLVVKEICEEYDDKGTGKEELCQILMMGNPDHVLMKA